MWILASTSLMACNGDTFTFVILIVRIVWLFIHYLSLISPLEVIFTWLTPPGLYWTTTCRETELNLDHKHTFLTTQGHGDPPRVRDQLYTGATSITTCRETELNLDHKHTFLTTQGHGGSPRVSDQLYTGATSKTTRTWKTIHTGHSPTHSF